MDKLYVRLPSGRPAVTLNDVADANEILINRARRHKRASDRANAKTPSKAGAH